MGGIYPADTPLRLQVFSMHVCKCTLEVLEKESWKFRFCLAFEAVLPNRTTVSSSGQ